MKRADWITRQEVARLTGWSTRTIERKQAAGELRSRITGAHENGKAVREYDAASLPAEAQLKRVEQSIRSVALVPVRQSSTAVATLPAPEKAEITVALSALDDEELAQVRERMEIIRPMIDFRNRTNGTRPVFETGSGEQITKLADIVAHLAKATNYGRSTIWEWWRRYLSGGGPAALRDMKRSDLGKSRFFAAHPQAALFLQNKYLNERRASLTMIYEEMVREWPRLRGTEAALPPDYKTVRTYLQREVSPLMKIICREGERSYNEKAAPFLIRDVNAKAVNEYWISDHMIHDVWVRNDGVFGELDDQEALRPCLTAIQDMKSRRWLGSVWCVNPSSDTISSALQWSLRHFGKPGTFYVDNGKDFKRLAKQAPRLPDLNEDAEGVLVSMGVLVRVGIRPQHCLPFHPQSKQIESGFHTLHQQFDVRWGDAYAGTSPKDRPEECDRARAQHEKLRKEANKLRRLGHIDEAAALLDRSPLPRASEFIQTAYYFLDEWNRTHRHSDLRGKTPQQVYDLELPPEKRQPVDLTAIAPLFWDQEERTIREGGCIRIMRQTFEPADAESRCALMQIIGEKIKVACDPANVAEAIAFDSHNRFLGRLRCQELMVHGDTSIEQIRASMRLRRMIFKAHKAYAASLERSRRVAGDMSLLESLKRRAAAASSVIPAPVIHALPMPRAVNAPAPERGHIKDIVDSFFEED